MAKLVFLGDSLTQWYAWHDRFPGHEVLNLGISGETVEGMLARREHIRTRVSAPDAVFLMTGINDIANGQYDIIGPYREIVRSLTTWYKRSALVVQSILPADLTWVDNNRIAHTNTHLARIAAEFDAEYLDLFGLFIDADGRPRQGHLSDDGVHLAREGYRAWADEVERLLQTLL